MAGTRARYKVDNYRGGVAPADLFENGTLLDVLSDVTMDAPAVCRGCHVDWATAGLAEG